jgi:hypothetical protein
MSFRARTSLLAFVSLGGLIGVLEASPAAAFCRTTTVHEPVPYDPVSDGCWFQGTPLAWAAGQTIAYSLSAAASNQIPLSQATVIAHRAFYAWTSTICPGGVINVSATDNGAVSADAAANDCGLLMCDPTVHDSLHVIVFDDNGWPHNDPNNTLALTTVTYGIDSGEIYDADIEINSAEHALTADEPPPTNAFDLQAILTHEAGHFFGLAHATDTAPIMYAQYKPGAIALTRDDINGICTVYPPQQGKTGCACDTVPIGSDAWAMAVCSGVLALAAARRRRGATSSRRSVP